MTYNVRFNNYDFNVVAQIILTYKPDFVSLQEIQPAMMNELQKRLINVYPYSLMGNEHPFGTTAILSRHPVLDAYILDLQTDRPAVVLKSEINGTKITVISAHLLAYGLQWVKIQDMPKAIMERTTNQNQQAQRIVEEIQNQDGIVILGCDCLRAPNKIKICSISITSFFEAI